MWGIELAVRDSALALAGALEGLLAALSEGAGGRDSLGERIEAAMQKLEALLLHDEWPQLPFADSLQRISATLGACRQAIGQEQASRWPSLQRELHEAYDAVAAALRADDASVRAARPNNYARSTFHVLSALLCLVLTLYVCTPAQLPWAAGAFAGTFWSLEITRRMWPRWNDLLLRLLGKIAHPSERHRVNSSTWYVTALTLLGLTQSPRLAANAGVVLAFLGIAFAAPFFTAYEKSALVRWVGEKLRVVRA